MHPALYPFLHRLHARSGLDDGELAIVEGCCSAISLVPREHDLVRQGGQPGELHVILAGWAYRTVLLPDGRRQIPALLLAGDICDLDGLSGDPLDFGVSTLSECSVAQFSPRAIRTAMGAHPRIARAFLNLAITENGVLTRWNLGLGIQRAPERMAHLFCELVTRAAWSRHAPPAAQGPALHIEFPLTQGELGDVLGLSAVHVNRTLQDLRAAGLVQLSRGTLEVLNWPKLAELGSFDPAYLHLPAKSGEER